MRDQTVERRIPRRRAAPFGPARTPPVCSRARMMCWRSTSRSVWNPAAAAATAAGRASAATCCSCTCRPSQRITARSSTLAQLRTLPGQWYDREQGACALGRESGAPSSPVRLANVWTGSGAPGSGTSVCRSRSGGTRIGKNVEAGSRGRSRKVPRRTALLQVAVGRRQDAHVDARRPGAIADRLRNSPLLAAREQLRLHVSGQLADLVEEEGAVSRQPRSGPACAAPRR